MPHQLHDREGIGAGFPKPRPERVAKVVNSESESDLFAGANRIDGVASEGAPGSL